MARQELIVAFLLSILVACAGSMWEGVSVMTVADALALPRPEADHRISYGDDPLQFGELRLPGGKGPYPVVIVIHGGCWLSEYDLGYVSALADALTESGLATWSIEYRRIGDDGGGWPGTFHDVADAAEALIAISLEHDLDLDRVAAVGHSAGGHLALWLAARKRLDVEDPFRGDGSIALNGIVALAAISDLAAYVAPEGCGAAVRGLLGGDSNVIAERLRRSSPIAMVPLGITQILVIGELDTIVPASQAHGYAEAAGRMGDAVEIFQIFGAGHFELVDPMHGGFDLIRDAVLRAVEPTSSR